MKRAIAAVLAACCVSAPAAAWVPRATGAGIAEQAALGSALHRRLVGLGFSRGLYEPLVIPPADAPALHAALALVPPSDGLTPDARGQQSALAWIAAGAVLAEINPAHAANHFFDPRTGAGWVRPSVGVSARVREWLGRQALPERGMPAPDWAVSADNPLGRAAFLAQLEKAIAAGTPGERQRHLASALVAAGALVSLLADLGSPSRVRGDARAHLDELGGGLDDLGSRFELLVAGAYGRLGVPAPGRVVTRARLRDFFTSADAAAPGLADATAARWFSAYTLPPAFNTLTATTSPVALGPRLPARLNLMAAGQPGGTTLRDAAGVCLARYQVERQVARFSTDDACQLEQARAILPEVTSYAAGLVDFLFRGALTVTLQGGAAQVEGAPAGVTPRLFAEDARGVRTAMTATAVPPGTRRVIALAVGVDAGGEPLVAAGAAVVE